VPSGQRRRTRSCWVHSASELVREGLRLVHKQAREVAMAASYDEFYGGRPAPVSEVTAALWPE